MRRYLFLILLLWCSIANASDVVDGRIFDEFEVTQWDGITAPSVSPANSGRIYYDSTADTLKLSINGGAYFDIATSSTLTAYYLLDGSNTTGIFYLDTNKYLKKIDANTVGLYVNSILVQDWQVIPVAPAAGTYMGFGGVTYS
jgi:hypothetical protein